MNKKLKGLLAILFVSCISVAFAQEQQIPLIPIEPDVRIGKLENGLTYYIRHNELPEGQANFYIAQKVGSILEEDNQRGLAHFLEHMCFNGTALFPGTSLRDYLASIGVKFGENLNAYTSIDETVYNINNVPVKRDPSVIDSCLYILRDWADGLLLHEEEIDKERGVIHEEWRTRTGAMMRMYEKIFPEIYPDSKYAYRLPIGTMEVVDNFPYQALRDYYEKWYRPDLQGIIIVGDINVDEIEEKIKSVFSPIKMPEVVAEREYFPVPDNKEPIVAIATDKEQQNVVIYYMNKHEAVANEDKTSMAYLVMNYAKDRIARMINERFSEIIRQSTNPPFMQAGAYDDDFLVAKTKGAFTGYAVCKEDGVETALTTLVREIERAHRFGFTEGEYARSRANYLSYLENAYNERDKVKNSSYTGDYIRHFLDNEPIPGIEYEYAVMNQIVPNIPLEAINQMLPELLSDSNQVLCVFAPDKEGVVYPDKGQLLDMINKVKAEDIEPYVDNVSDEPLISELPQAGKVVKTEDGMYDSKIYTLSNGIKVIIKPTDFKADEIRMSAYSPGGTSLYPDNEILNLRVLDQVVTLGGLGNFSAVELPKILAGKIANVSPYFNSEREGVSGSCAPKDFETMMQLTYLTFTAPRMDNDAFESYKNRSKAALHNQELNPMTAFSDSATVALYNHHPRAISIKADMIDKIDYERTMEIYKERFKDAGDFTFIFVGNIDSETAIPLIKQYIGALPATGRQESFKDNEINIRTGLYSNNFERAMETPKSAILLLYSGNDEYNLKNTLMMSMFGQIMDMVYTETVREDEGGTYGVSVGGSISKYPKEESYLQIYFDTDPERRARMTEVVQEGIDNFIQKGPDAEKLANVKEFMLKKYKENQKENGYWAGSLNNYYWNHIDAVTDYENVVNSITAQDLQNYAKKLIKQGNRIEVSITGTKN